MTAPAPRPGPSAAVPDPADVEKAADRRRAPLAMSDEEFAFEPVRLSTLAADEESRVVLEELIWEYGAQAAARALTALAAVRPSPDSEAVARAEAVCAELDREGVVQWFHGPHNRNGHITARIRAAIAAPVAQAGEGR